jgi:Tol biopolymer transport system component
MGAPFWHPSGRYIVFVAEKKEHPGGSMPALPGFGGWCDIWLITPDGLHAWKLVDEPVDPARAILLPCFSPDGKRLAWCERITRPKLLDNLRGAGTYIIHTADFVETPTPHVANIRDYRPAGEAFYETSCFTPDSQSLLMTSNCDTKNFWQNQIYRFDLATQQLHRLTHDTSYNEHPQMTPDGRSIIWMSDTDTDGLHLAHGTDWWLMDPDGSHPRRISTMNVRTSPQCDGKAKWACTVTWSPDGRWFYGDVQTNLITQAGKVVRVDLP